jgi:hypothetical protein
VGGWSPERSQRSKGLTILGNLAKVRLLDDISQQLNTMGWSQKRLDG